MDKQSSTLFRDTLQAFRKALVLQPDFAEAKEHLAIVLTDLGTRFKLAGNAQEGIQRYYEAIEVNPRCAVSHSCSAKPYLSHASRHTADTLWRLNSIRNSFHVLNSAVWAAWGMLDFN